MLTGRKYRLKLTPEQEAQCEEFGNICRAVWNIALEQRREYRRRGALMSYVRQSAQLTEAKREHDWLREAPSSTLQQTLRDLDKACRHHGTFKVNWRSKGRWAPSFRFPDAKLIRVERLGRKWGRVKLSKLGWVDFRWSRHPGGEIRSATVSRKAGHWYVSFLIEDGTSTPEHHAGTPVGVDRGVKVVAATSTGRFYNREFVTAVEKARYRRLQQRLSRTRKGSANHRKMIAAMNRISSRATNRRADFCAWTASRLSARHSMVVLEDLRIRNMTSSAKGTIAAPGSNVRQKAGLNRAILDKGWHQMELAIRNAARATGTQVVLVNPAYTSQMCNQCGHVDAKNRKSQAVFVCTACKHRDHADVNAAKNILSAAGHAVPACGDLAVRQSVKQELPGPREVVPVQLAFELIGISRL